MKRLVVGIDPGVTCGVAALTLEGTPVFVGSRRDWKLSGLLEKLTTLGEPVIVSSDVSPAPELVKKVSANLDATIFTPLISIGTVEKQRLARSYAESYDMKLRNTHEIDALAAALKAYNHFKDKFEHVEMRVKDLDYKISIDGVKALVVKGYTMNKAIDYLRTKPIEKTPPLIPVKKVLGEERLKEMVKQLNQRLVFEKEEEKRLRAENKKLRRKTKSLEKEISSLEEKIDEIRSQQTIQIRREREFQKLIDEAESLKRRVLDLSAQLEEYRQRFNALQRVRELESKGELILLKPIERFTAEGLRRAFRVYEIKPGDHVLLLDASGGGATTARKLAERGVRALILQTAMAHQARDGFAKYDIPLISADQVKIEWTEGFPYVDASSLKDALKGLKSKEVSELTSRVQCIIEEHRKELKNKNWPMHEQFL